MLTFAEQALAYYPKHDTCARVALARRIKCFHEQLMAALTSNGSRLLREEGGSEGEKREGEKREGEEREGEEERVGGRERAWGMHNIHFK